MAMCTFVDMNKIARNDQGNKSSSSRECQSGLVPSPFKSNKENRGKKCHREVVGIYSIQSRIRQHTTQHQTWISPTPVAGGPEPPTPQHLAHKQHQRSSEDRLGELYGRVSVLHLARRTFVNHHLGSARVLSIARVTSAVL